MNGQIQYDPPSAVTPVPTPTIVAGSDACHFLAPVRCGRRRTDQFGHLELTTERLRFHGPIDLNFPWSDVSGVARDGRDIIVSLKQHQRRMLRFSCYTIGEAAAGADVALRLAALSVSTV